MRWRLMLAFLATLAAVSCGDEPTDPMDDPACRALLGRSDAVDAVEWLKRPSPAPKLQGGLTDEDALAIAARLQQLGVARMTTFEDDPGRPSGAGAPAPTGRGMVAELPGDPARRVAIFRLYARQVRSLGKTPRADTGQAYLFIPWTLGGDSKALRD